MKDHIKLESEQKLQSDLKFELMPYEERCEALDLGEIRKEAHRIYQREQDELKKLNPAEEQLDPELLNPPRIPKAAQFGRPLKAKVFNAEKDSD